MRLHASLFLLTWCILPLFHPVLANNEKLVLLAPENIQNLNQQPGLDQLNLPVLTPSNSTIRTHLNAAFPNPRHPLGTETWLLLDQLAQHQRYEVRVCWSANVMPPLVAKYPFNLSLHCTTETNLNLQIFFLCIF